LVSPGQGIGYDYSVYASEVKWTVTCTRSCDVYLIDESNLNKLKAGIAFKFEKKILKNKLLLFFERNNVFFQYL
jgi:hypothetical protein